MFDSIHGPYVGTGSSSADNDEPSVEMMRTRTVQPTVSIPDMLKTLIPAAVMIMAVFWINASQVNPTPLPNLTDTWS